MRVEMDDTGQDAAIRTKTRKRGVSIENVMLGLIIVLIFAGLLYGAFTVVQRYLVRQEAQRDIQAIVMEAFMFRGSVNPNLNAQMIDAGVVPVSMQAGPGMISLPYDGYAVFSLIEDKPNVVRMSMNWDRPGRSAVALCHFLSGGSGYETENIATPVGSNVTISTNLCPAGTLALTFYPSYN